MFVLVSLSSEPERHMNGMAKLTFSEFFTYLHHCKESSQSDNHKEEPSQSHREEDKAHRKDGQADRNEGKANSSADPVENPFTDGPSCEWNDVKDNSSMAHREEDPANAYSSSVENPFTDSSSSSWEPDTSDDGNSETEEETTVIDRCLSKGSRKTSQTPTQEREEEVVSDSGSSVASIAYPMLSAAAEVPPIAVQPNIKKWSKYHCCYFCEKQVIKMARHLEQKHSTESLVVEVLGTPKGTNERRKGWMKIINDGDYQHNFQVIEKGEGTVIPRYRGRQKGVEGLVPCPSCKGLYSKKKVTTHSFLCSGQKRKAYREGSMMLPVPRHVSKSLWQNVLLKMKEDAISQKAKNDSLILAFGERMYNKRDVEEHTAGQVSCRMRELARLVLDLEGQTNGEIRSLNDALLVKHFETLIKSVRSLAEYSDETHSFKKGSLALKLGYSVKKCVTIMKALAIQNSDKHEQENADSFLALFGGNWCDHISSTANQSIERTKFNKPQLLPCCQDVEKLYSFVKHVASDDYPTLVRAAMCEISLFNRKRGGEIQRMTLETLETGRKNQAPADEEIMASLTPIERKLVGAFTRIEIRGKFNRRVAILLTQSMLNKIDKIMRLRDHLSITSKYLFATPNGERPYRGSDVIHVMAVEAGVKDPHIFTWTSLRKQVATISQAMEISETEQDQLAQFLGHDIRVHRDFYRLPHDILQKAKVAKILLRINAGNVATTSDLSLEDELQPDMDDINNSSDESEFGDEDDCLETTKRHETIECVKITSAASSDCSVKIASKTAGSRNIGVKRKWTQEEKNAVLKNLKAFIQMKKVPGKADVEKVKQKEECLNGRSWRNIKDFCYNMIKKQ